MVCRKYSLRRSGSIRRTLLPRQFYSRAERRATGIYEAEMVTKRITEVTVQTDEVLIIRRPESPLPIWCAACAAAVAVVTPEEAAAVARVSWRAVAAWVAESRLHCTEEPEGFLL